jgi:hypothetical protein
MKFRKGTDILLNILLPLLAGCLIYCAGNAFYIPALIRNYGPDGLWAYALMTAVLVIWDRKWNITWIGAVFCMAVGFEWLQYAHRLPGTGDPVDVLVYSLFFVLALLLNPFFKTLIITQPHKP